MIILKIYLISVDIKQLMSFLLVNETVRFLKLEQDSHFKSWNLYSFFLLFFTDMTLLVFN